MRPKCYELFSDLGLGVIVIPLRFGFRVPAVYLKLAFLLFHKINKLRGISTETGFEPLQVHHNPLRFTSP